MGVGPNQMDVSNMLFSRDPSAFDNFAHCFLSRGRNFQELGIGKIRLL